MKSFKSFLLASALGLFVAVPLARAAEQEVPLKEAPEAVQKAIHREEGKGAKNTQVWQVVHENQDYFMVHYVAADGKHMRLRTHTGRCSPGARPASRRTRTGWRQPRRPRSGRRSSSSSSRRREAADRRTFEAWQASQASQASSATPARPAHRTGRRVAAVV